MTIWSSIWSIIIASLLICHCTMLINHSFLCIYFCSQFSFHESEEESDNQIMISHGLNPLPHSYSLLIIYLPTSLLLSFGLCLFNCLLISFFLFLSKDAGFLPRRPCLPQESLSSLCIDARNLHRSIKSVLFHSNFAVATLYWKLLCPKHL